MKITSRTGLLPGKRKVILFRKQVKENTNRILFCLLVNVLLLPSKIVHESENHRITHVINLCYLVDINHY